MSTPTGAFGTAPEPAKPEIDVLSAVLPASAEPEPSFGKVLSDSGSSSGGNNAKLRGNTLDSPPEPEPKRDGGRGNSSEENCDGFFNVLSADKSKALSIPAELIEPTIGSKNYVSRNRSTKVPSYALYLCKSFSTSGNCAHGSRCDFIHSRHDLVETCGSNSRVSVIQVHWSTPVCSLEDALYEGHEPGFIFHINPGPQWGGGNYEPPGSCSREYVYRPKGR
uniref:Uncharacterized protein TCIL3000_11_16470 n=1 Tax=Trypanosoma congolense (strain IL3000) TaxID=1068625 RepID=G0V3B2_TRYCI|nr:unnamed protein product [Trypanosoma congolense IL3000]